MSNIDIYYLEMHSPAHIKGKPSFDGLRIEYCEIKQWALNKFLYSYVGGPWTWTDKLNDADNQWQAYAQDPKLHTWVAYYKGAIAGYFEMQQQAQGDVEIIQFGLTPEFVGKGMGGYLLTNALEQAWSLPNTKRVWLHTCSLDHPNAKANYEARGFTHYKTEQQADD
ncbi:MAG: GNAT superfamily N-acetyltransferase [Oceanicoccus sp.]|jgi:GNAT superfamily N-acetyltransferase